MFDHSKFYYFYQIKPTVGEFSFSSYSDTQSGDTYKAIQSMEGGKEKPFFVRFSARERFYRFPKTQTVTVKINGDKIKKMSVYEYVKGFPLVEGSPFSYGAQPIIKEFDEVKDAAVAVDRKKRRLDAGNVVLNMKAKEVAEICPLFGIFNDDPGVQLNRLLEIADQDPEAFFSLYNAPDKDVRALIRKAISATTITRQGKALLLEFEKGKKQVFADEDELVSALLKDASLLKALQVNTNKIK